METSVEPEEGRKINWRQFGKHWIVVLILAILAAFVIWGMLNAGPWLKQWQDWRAARTLQSELEKLYRNDKYGGKTPEETFNMFITALEKGDIELASKYFVIEKQENWLRTLNEYKKEGLIGNVVAELKDTKNGWAGNQTNDPNAAEFYSSVKTEEGSTVTNITKFLKYPSGAWKISVL